MNEDRYELLRDLPNVKAGAIFEKSHIGKTWFYSWTIRCDIPSKDQVGFIQFGEETIQDKDWFRKIEPMRTYYINGVKYEVSESEIRKVIDSVFAKNPPDPIYIDFNKTKEDKPKEWEIVAFYDGCINGKIDSRCLRENTSAWGDDKIISLGFTIHSVKRLSDGEVFSVGEKFFVTPGYKEHTIKKFSTNGYIMYAVDDISYSLPHLMKESKINNPKERIEIWIDPDKMYYIIYPFLGGLATTNLDGITILERLFPYCKKEAKK